MDSSLNAAPLRALFAQKEFAVLPRLQAKIDAYLAFIESGETVSNYPAATGRALVIEAILKYRPTAAALESLT